VNGEINLNIPPICILCGGKNFEDSIKLNNINFFRDKRYIRIPLCEKHFEREMTISNLYYKAIKLTKKDLSFKCIIFPTKIQNKKSRFRDVKIEINSPNICAICGSKKIIDKININDEMSNKYIRVYVLQKKDSRLAIYPLIIFSVLMFIKIDL
jgi:hypothetical protein